MSTKPTPTEINQGSSGASFDKYPTGPILLVEPQQAHEQFIRASSDDLTVLLRLSHVPRLLDRNEDADSYFGPNCTVITTTTVHDAWLAATGWQEERDLVSEFEPDFHIPCDYPVYKGYDPEKRRTHIRWYLRGLLWMAEELAETPIELLPLIKGETTSERQLCYRVFEALDVQYCVFYGTQYYQENVGFYQLLSDLHHIVSEQPDLNIMLIGLQSPRRLGQLPPQVVAAAGQRWIRDIGLRDHPPKTACQRYPSFERSIEEKLGRGQTPITTWIQTEVHA